MEVHSSLKSFGYVEGGGKTVIEALMETISKCNCMFFNIWDVVGLYQNELRNNPYKLYGLE